VLLEEWIDGVPLTSAAVEDRHLAEAAAVLAEVHLVEALAGVPVREWGDTAARLAATETRLQRLAGAGALDEASRTVLASALRDHDPRRAEIGLVHLDFCPENLVIDREGRLRVVDNEALAVDALAYDLGRSWYRSALPPARWALFEAAYRRHGGPAASAGSTLFWRIAAVTEGAITRLERDSRGAQPSLDRLGQLAAELRRSAAAPPAART
jgi:aminoglycoside phosphotransferase (APT) family kinase protein